MKLFCWLVADRKADGCSMTIPSLRVFTGVTPVRNCKLSTSSSLIPCVSGRQRDFTSYKLETTNQQQPSATYPILKYEYV